MNPEMIDELMKLAKRKCWCDKEDFCVEDFACGNVDDAYEGGISDGKSDLARMLLEKLGIEY